ncbi:MAG: DUF177 domain-containing protein [Candidatus Gracilibacteria bacterium]|jgi:uncharacterized protein|nr:DUF177 domain-containing protein [Candidatus Gracilibacteria bacterium]
MDIFKFEVGHLLHEETGKTTEFSFDLAPDKKDFPEMNFSGNLSGEVTVMRVDNGVSVSVQNLKASIIFDCQKCLKTFEKELEIEEIERIFWENPTIERDDPTEFFQIDMKSQKIDISDMLRQEIILHFPPVSVCSKSCKGLCSLCGANLNVEKCECKAVEDLKPLSILKELYNGKTSGTQTKDL